MSLDSESFAVLFLSGDLMFASRVRAAAERAGYEFRLATSLPETSDDGVRYVVLDLSTRSTLVPTIVEGTAQQCPNAELIAYGPHVQINRLSAAREAGVPRVLTRGQFDQMLGGLFVHQ